MQRECMRPECSLDLSTGSSVVRTAAGPQSWCWECSREHAHGCQLCGVVYEGYLDASTHARLCPACRAEKMEALARLLDPHREDDAEPLAASYRVIFAAAIVCGSVFWVLAILGACTAGAWLRERW